MPFYMLQLCDTKNPVPRKSLQTSKLYVYRTWEQLVGQKRSVGSPSNPVQSAHDEFSAIRSAQYQLPSAPACTASYPRNYTPSSFAPSCLPTAMSGDSMVQCSMPFGYLHSARSDNIADRCMSLPAAPVQAWSNQALGENFYSNRTSQGCAYDSVYVKCVMMHRA